MTEQPGKEKRSARNVLPIAAHMPLLKVAVAKGDLAGVASIGMGHSGLYLDAVATDRATPVCRNGRHGFVLQGCRR